MSYLELRTGLHRILGFPQGGTLANDEAIIDVVRCMEQDTLAAHSALSAAGVAHGNTLVDRIRSLLVAAAPAQRDGARTQEEARELRLLRDALKLGDEVPDLRVIQLAVDRIMDGPRVSRPDVVNTLIDGLRDPGRERHACVEALRMLVGVPRE